MKTLLIIAALFCGLGAVAQVQVVAKKNYKISNREQKTIDAEVKRGDTTFYFCFRNAKYTTITDFQCAQLDPVRMKAFVDALVELTDSKHIAGEASVELGDLLLEKAEMLGSPYVRVWYKSLGWTSYRPGQCRKVQDEVYTFLGVPR